MIYQKFTYKTGTFQWLCQFTRGSFFRSGDLAPWLGDRGYSRDYSTQYIEDDHNPLRESLVTEGTQSISYGFFPAPRGCGTARNFPVRKRRKRWWLFHSLM